jgi:hypothetical protein
MVNAVVQAKPSDPKIGMIRYLAERTSAMSLQDAGVFVSGRLGSWLEDGEEVDIMKYLTFASLIINSFPK